MPFWDFLPQKTLKQDNLCITFNTGKYSHYIFEYLKERKSLGYSLKPNTPLFHTLKNPNFLANNVISKTFQRLNDKIQLGKYITGKYVKFRVHNLRKLFSTTCRINISKISINPDNYNELDIIIIFVEHMLPNTKNHAYM